MDTGRDDLEGDKELVGGRERILFEEGQEIAETKFEDDAPLEGLVGREGDLANHAGDVLVTHPLEHINLFAKRVDFAGRWVCHSLDGNVNNNA